MAFLAGTVLALAVRFLAAFSGLDRDRAFYPTVLIVIASYYALFAVMNGSISVLMSELLVIAAFIGVSIAGFKRSLWLVVVALAGHGVFDLVHGQLIDNPGVPLWWPNFFLAFDIVAATYLAALLRRSKVPATVA